MDLDESLSDLPTRPMRVKVLYTFDSESKTNCLARLSGTLNIPAVAIDEQNTQIGIIGLQQCVQALTGASPELVSRLDDGDFTIYAYDYSEPDTPLVGQGMLSLLLGGVETERKMITGRVCRNVIPALSQGAKETLEVKLRLVPVTKQTHTRSMQSNFGMMSPATSAGFDPNAWQQSQQSYQQDYFATFDDKLQQQSQRDQALMDDIFDFGGNTETQMDGNSGQQAAVTGEGGIAETPTESSFHPNPAFLSDYSHSAPGSRAGSPMIAPEYGARNSQLRHHSFSANTAAIATEQSRPASSASMRSEFNSGTHHQRAASQSLLQTTQQNDLHYGEDGQPRKRAKVIQTDWHGRSKFGKSSADLRVTAATAASVHMHRPIAQRPNAAPGSNLEPPPRVPTPVPHLGRTQSQRQSGNRSLLRQASTASMMGSEFLSDIESPANSQAIMSSPEDEQSPSDSGQGTPPLDIPSSPPVFPDVNVPQPSSPGLPTLPLPRAADSGYMSEPGKAFQSSTIMVQYYDGDDEDRSPTAEDMDIASQYAPRTKGDRIIKKESVTPSERAVKHPLPPSHNFVLQAPGDMSQLPNRMLLTGLEQEQTTGQRHSQAKSAKSNANRPSKTVVAQQNMEASAASYKYEDSQTPGPEHSQSRRGSLALPAKALPPQHPHQQSEQKFSGRSYSIYDRDAESPVPSDNESAFRPQGPQRSGSGAQRRKVIEQRLQTSLANGEVPPFCAHCGALETPTWRRMYLKLCEGKPSPLDSVEGEGETIATDEIEWDETTGECTKFVIRKSMRKAGKIEGGVQAGKGFRDVQVCNPCGLWFNRFRTMRPPEKWNRKSYMRRKSGKKLGGDVGMSTDGIEPRSDLPQSEAFFTDAPLPEDLPGPGTTEQQHKQNGIAGLDGAMDDHQSKQAVKGTMSRPRANSMQPRLQNDAVLARDAQSSPGRFQGSKESPIELEEGTPRPTRRQLFPSPRREGEFRSLNGLDLLSTKRKSTSPGKLLPQLKRQRTAPGDIEGVTDVWTARTDQENMPPPHLEEPDELAYLFEGSPTATFKTPGKFTTPRKTGSGRSISAREVELLKTPTPTTSIRKPLTPNANAANNANLNAATTAAAPDWLTSPASGRYFLRSTPTRLANTPNRSNPTSHHGSQHNGSQQMTPFSRHLAQILAQEEGGTLPFTSPSKAGVDGTGGQFDFSDLPTFMTPGRDVDWDAMEEILSSEFGNYEDVKQGAKADKEVDGGSANDSHGDKQSQS